MLFNWFSAVPRFSFLPVGRALVKCRDEYMPREGDCAENWRSFFHLHHLFITAQESSFFLMMRSEFCFPDGHKFS